MLWKKTQNQKAAAQESKAARESKRSAGNFRQVAGLLGTLSSSKV
jgi:hypothetical protein